MTIAGAGCGAGFGGAPAAWTPDEWAADRVLDYTADDVLTAAGLTTAFVNQVAGGPDATQANAALQAAAPAARASLNGALAVHFTSDGYTIADVNSTETSHAHAAVLDNQDVTSTYQYLLDAQTGRKLSALVWAPAGHAGAYVDAGASFGASTAITGAQRLTWDFNGTTLKHYRGGVQVGADETILARAMDAAGGFGQGFDAAAGFLVDCYMGRATLLKRAWTADDEAKWSAWASRYYGV